MYNQKYTCLFSCVGLCLHDASNSEDTYNTFTQSKTLFLYIYILIRIHGYYFNLYISNNICILRYFTVTEKGIKFQGMQTLYKCVIHEPSVVQITSYYQFRPVHKRILRKKYFQGIEYIILIIPSINIIQKI